MGSTDLIYFYKGEFFEVVDDEKIPIKYRGGTPFEGGELISFDDISWSDLNRWRTYD